MPLCVSVTRLPATVTLIVRADGWAFARTCSVNVPLPVLAEQFVIETQLTLGLSAADHAHPLCVVTVIVTAPPAGPTVGASGETTKVHVPPLACVTVLCWPAMRSVPDRAGPVLAAAVKPTVPLPVPLAPLVTVIQPA